MELSDEQIRNLTREINILKEEKMQQSEIIDSFKKQVFLGSYFSFLHVFDCHDLIPVNKIQYDKEYVCLTVNSVHKVFIKMF
jgi:hypothetical protein